MKREWPDYMRMYLGYLVSCTHLLFLDGYQESQGAMLEAYIANRLGIKYADTIEALKKLVDDVQW